MAQEFFFKTGIERAVAIDRIKQYRDLKLPVRGVYYGIADIADYITKYADIIRQHNIEIPEGYAFQVGHYFALNESGSTTFIVAPVLVNTQAPFDVLDAFEQETLFMTELRTAGDQPHFFYNEGHLWP